MAMHNALCCYSFLEMEIIFDKNFDMRNVFIAIFYYEMYILSVSKCFVITITVSRYSYDC